MYHCFYEIPVKANAIELDVQHNEHSIFLFFLERKKDYSPVKLYGRGVEQLNKLPSIAPTSDNVYHLI